MIYLIKNSKSKSNKDTGNYAGRKEEKAIASLETFTSTKSVDETQ